MESHCNCIHMTGRDEEGAQKCKIKYKCFCPYTSIGAKELCKHYKRKTKS